MEQPVITAPVADVNAWLRKAYEAGWDQAGAGQVIKPEARIMWELQTDGLWLPTLTPVWR